MPNLEDPGSRWFTTSHSIAAVAGVIGVFGVSTSEAVQDVLGPLVIYTVWAWSVALILSGAMGVWARMSRRYRAETSAVFVTAGALFLWATVVLVATPLWSWGTQIATWMFGAVSFMVGWALYRRARLNTNAALAAEALRAATGG